MEGRAQPHPPAPTALTHSYSYSHLCHKCTPLLQPHLSRVLPPCYAHVHLCHGCPPLLQPPLSLGCQCVTCAPLCYSHLCHGCSPLPSPPPPILNFSRPLSGFAVVGGMLCKSDKPSILVIIILSG